MLKKVLLLLISLLTTISLFACVNNDNNSIDDTTPYVPDYNFDYIYVLDGFTYDISSLVVDEDSFILPDLEGMSRAEIKYILDSLGALYDFEFAKVIVKNDSERNKFVSYSHNLVSGDIVRKDKFFYVYTTSLPLVKSYYLKLEMDLDYEGKSFIDDGVGEVTLIRTVDGDTAYFRDLNGEEIKCRFLCIDTPESTIDHDPWGKEASNFTANILRNATTIVLEAEMTNRKDVYGRYLGYVWVDGYLLNLRLIDEAYTNSAAYNSKYRDILTEAGVHAKKTGRRFYGEIDPNYDYERGDFK